MIRRFCALLLLIAAAAQAANRELWRPPSEAVYESLVYGRGGQEHEPRGVFTFLEEDLHGRSPKILVKDENGLKWKLKFGAEPRAEVAASRLVWAAGFFATATYYVPEVHVRGLPARLHRGDPFITAGAFVHRARLRPNLPEEKKIGAWAWRENPFTGTREFNALRVMMSVLSNWDLTDENNSIYAVHDPGSGITVYHYLVTDLGSSFGGGRLTWPLSKNRDNLRLYRRSKFITRVTQDSVDFHVPVHPTLFFLAIPQEYFGDCRRDWIPRRIPRSDAKWLGELLSQLSPAQLRDAFRAGGYSQEEVEGFAAVVEDRISQLRNL